MRQVPWNHWQIDNLAKPEFVSTLFEASSVVRSRASRHREVSFDLADYPCMTRFPSFTLPGVPDLSLGSTWHQTSQILLSN